MSLAIVRRPAALSAALLLLGLGSARASSIEMPAGSRSWIVVASSDCDDDGPNVNVDRGHCVGAVSQLLPAGDVGHGQFGPGFAIVADATIGPELFRGSVRSTGNFTNTFVDMSMIDTYTLHSKTLPEGTTVSVTVHFEFEATLTPIFNVLAFGGGAVSIRIGDGFQTAPIVIPENTRVTGNLGPTASQQVFYGVPQPSGAPIPIHLSATNSFTAQIGVPFDRSYFLGLRPASSEIDFHNTGTIGFDLPDGVTITSTGGFGAVVPVAPASWSAIKSRVR
ncbi:MAG TPA: hypothetical protein VF720_03765 [Candidatus Eisenbacteria bacterium]